MAKLIGADEGLSGDTNGGGYYTYGTKFTASASGTLNEMRFYAPVASLEYGLAVYSDSAGSADAVLNQTTTTPGTTGWKAVAFPNTSITSGTDYWLMTYINDGSNYTFRHSSTQAVYKKVGGGANFPDPFGTPEGTASGGTLMAGYSTGSTSPSISPSASVSPSVSLSPSVSPSVSLSPSVSPSQSPSLSLSPSQSPSLSPSTSPSASPSVSVSPSVSLSPSVSPSASPSVSPSPSPVYAENPIPYIEVTEEQANNLSLPIAKKKLTTWNTLGRPTGASGLFGGNTTTNKIEWYTGSAWKNADGTDV